MKKIAFFDRKHGLTPLEKCHFLRPSKNFLIVKKKVSFLSRASLNLISSLFLTENESRKKLDFLTKRRVNPFGKMPFLSGGKIVVYLELYF